MTVSPGVNPRPSLNGVGEPTNPVSGVVSPGVNPRPSLNEITTAGDTRPSPPVSPGVNPRPSLNVHPPGRVLDTQPRRVAGGEPPALIERVMV